MPRLPWKPKAQPGWNSKVRVERAVVAVELDVMVVPASSGAGIAVWLKMAPGSEG